MNKKTAVDQVSAQMALRRRDSAPAAAGERGTGGRRCGAREHKIFALLRNLPGHRRYAACLLAGALALIPPASSTASAEDTATATVTTSTTTATGCKNSTDALGLAREVEIDTRSGPQFGRQQYKQHDFLRHKEVVLTFDDGPSRVFTKPILDLLDKHCTKATFFMVGRMARSDPEMVREVGRRGHTVANHTWSHQDLNQRSKQRGIREIELGISAVSKALGKPAAPFFRFPYLADPRRMRSYLKSRHISIFSIDIDSKDYRTSSGDRVTRKILRDLKYAGKGIILFHDIQRSTARALPGLLKKLHRRGYKVVHIVPKRDVTTLAAFDAMAQKRFSDRNRTALNAHRHGSGLGTQARSRRLQRKSRRSKKASTKGSAAPPSRSWTNDAFQGG